MGETRGSAAPAPVRNRCRCGHFPSDHMRVAAITDRSSGGFRLDTAGPCSVCGEESCPKFAATG